MCGIAGVISQEPRRENLQESSAMIQAIRHRGPDGQQTWFSPSRCCALAHARLAILDTSDAGAQPMHSSCGRHTIVFNGEIYNFLELRGELEGLGHHFVSGSDTEVLLSAFREWGEACLPRLNGMFAFAIWDETERCLFLARDRFGVKPLHFACHSGTYYFASELKAFRALRGFPLKMDPLVRERILADPFSVESTGRTLLAGVEQIRAGHFARISRGGVQSQKWWNLADHLHEVPNDSSSQVDLWKELFFDSLRIRLRSDVPVGTALSGGFDSSAILCSLADLIRGGRGGAYAGALHKAFVATFPGEDNDETAEARRVLDHSGVQGDFFELGNEDPTATIEQSLTSFEGIYITLPSAVGRIYQEQRRAGIVVSLDGHGCDEMMGAYWGSQGSQLQNAPPLFKSPLTNLRMIREHFTRLKKEQNLPGYLLVKDGLRQVFRIHPSLDWARGFYHQNGIRPLYCRKRVPLAKFPEMAEWGSHPKHEQALALMFQHTILPTLLRNFDRMSMAHGVEIRMPFLDWRLVALTFSLPEQSKFSGELSKWVAREAMRGVVPEEIRTARKKIGFGFPLGKWMNGPLGDWSLEVVESAPTDHDLIDVPRLRRAMRARNIHRSWASDIDTIRAWHCVSFLWFESRFLRAGEHRS